jgi:hypothetical protein
LKEQLKAVTATLRPLTVAEIELRATIKARNGQRRKAYELFRTAADMEAALIYTEPPSTLGRLSKDGWRQRWHSATRELPNAPTATP